MEIRDARPADAAAVAAVARGSWHAAYDDLLGPETVDETVDAWYDIESLREGISEAVADPGRCFFVAESDDGDGVAGFANAGGARDWESDPDGPDAFFSRLYVVPDHWGEGIGTRLSRAVARHLRDQGHERVWLEVFAANERGRAFYESLGFERIGSVTETFGGTDVTTLHLAAPVDALATATAERP
ncbi:GNAT family N-acetyltransferase [Halolamina salifodinae]|uniref:Ribosomal protein S18 acetylase RimI-like enzyme n=1 Tax=Halolamina salifodinae TaxID=1202767 RepID=A0A8T4GTP4_9EURY|nr:GNAT family N-acetyltransferase [Halolamina salifodinae]MBP1986461.1 ribosomal protein S18 acetylase RimI-like enzyme [Halolamina salifodinae]